MPKPERTLLEAKASLLMSIKCILWSWCNITLVQILKNKGDQKVNCSLSEKMTMKSPSEYMVKQKQFF